MRTTKIRRLYGKLFHRFYGHPFFKPRTVIKKVNHITYELDLGQLIDSSIYFYGCFEPDVTECLAKLIEPGMTVIDVGANIGSHTLPMAQSVGHTGRVLAFEPMAWARKKLIRNVGLNQFSNILIEELALSDRTENQTVRFRSNWPLDGKHQPEANIVQEIQLETLDNYTETKDVSVDLIKIDVDGYEYKVFRGARQLLQESKPFIVAEIGDTVQRVGESVDEMIQFLSDLGYDFYSAASLERIQDPIAVIRSLPDRDAAMNMVLIPGAGRDL